MRKLIPVAIIAAAIVLLIVGFSGLRMNRGTGANVSADTGADVDSSADTGKITIYFIPKNMGNPYFDAVSTGFYDAIAELGEEKFRYVYTGPETAHADNQIEYVKKAVQNKANAIFVAANSDSALNDVFDEARSAGARIYIINQDITGNEEHRDAAIMPADFDTVGSAQLELLGSQIDYEGQFAILSATEDAPDQNTWIELIKAELKDDPKYKKMRLVKIAYGDDQSEKSASEMEAILSGYPDLKGVISPTAVGLPAACRVVKAKGAKHIKITGLGLPSEMAEFVIDGTCEGFQLWNPPYEGYISVYLAWAEKNKGFSPVPGAAFSAGKLGERRVLPNGQIRAMETPMLYDKTNIEKYAILF
jgi:rhamnose transport system substrate-binding protein